MSESEELERLKLSLQNVNNLTDIKQNPVVGSVLLAPIKALPVIGDLVDSTTDKMLENFQHKKEQELIEVILQDNTHITTSMVNDVEFIINYARVIDSVKRLAVNDKVAYFGNLIRNGYLSGKHISSNVFDEYLNILNTMSYREIQYLVDYKIYCENGKIKSRTRVFSGGRQSNNKWIYFSVEYSKKLGISQAELHNSFVRIKQTGFLEEEFETESGDVDKDDNTFDSLSIDTKGFLLTKNFDDFYEMVLKTDF